MFFSISTSLALIRCLVFLAIWLAAPVAQAVDPIVVRFSHVVDPNTPKGLAASEFKRLAERRTRGRVKIELHANASLYKDKEELEALQLGAVHMLAPSLAKFGQLGLSDFEVFDLPYIFPNMEVLRAVTDGPIGRDLLRQLEDKGLKGLAFWDNGFKVFSANRPIESPESLSGLRLRIQPSRVIAAQAQELGATPIPLKFSDAYPALRSGLVDGTENPPSNLYSKQMHTVQSHVVTTFHGYLGYVVIVNRKFWLSLPSDIRETLERCVRDATLRNNQEAEKLNQLALDRVRAFPGTQVRDLTDKERKRWQKAMAPVHDKMRGHISADLIDRILRVSKLHPSNTTQ